MQGVTRRLAVWGDPISHSMSPVLHRAAYARLGLDWTYERRQVAEAGFADALAGLDASWLGLSVTMPLKGAAHRAARTLDPHAALTGAVNTLLLDEAGPRGYNTDVGGIVDALADADIRMLDTVRLLGAGATAASTLVAAAELGATRADVRARRPERAEPLVALGERLGVAVTARGFAAPAEPVDMTLSSLPGGAALDADVVTELAASGGALFDAAYAPWPSAFAAVWPSSTVVSGLGMLLHQAVRQVRIFAHGDPFAALDDEQALVSDMRAALAAA